MVNSRTRSPRSPRSPPPISYPLPFDYPVPRPSSSTTSNAMPSRDGHSRKPSVTNPITWLSRSSNASQSKSHPYSPSKPIRISEPKFNSLFDPINNPRSGPLGSGATVVKTPHEALCGTTVHLTHEGVETIQPTVEEEDEPVYDDVFARSPQSPPLPPVPLSPVLIFETSKPKPQVPRPLRLSTPSPPVAHAQLGPSTKSRSPPTSDYSYPLTALSTNITAPSPQPPFEAILVSPLPTHAIDPSKIIISLETSTETHRTTLSTLTSRPSHLASYLRSLVPGSRQEPDSVSVDFDAASPTTPDSPFNSVFHNHLTSSGLIPPSSSTIHIFLDRPSAPYAHILTYLRTAPATSEFPATLPHAVQLIVSSSARLEALLTLRDEARYLGLDELWKLCSDEIRQRHEQKRGGRSSHGSSTGGASSHTLRDPIDHEPRFVYRDSGETKSVHARLSDPEKHSVVASLPTSPSLKQRRRSRSLVNIFTPPPAGWI